MTKPSPALDRPLRALAAGSLRRTLSLIFEDFTNRTGVKVEAGFGPSGLLRQKIEAGEECHLFASADRSHPRSLADQGLAREPVLFAGNRTCVLVREGLSIDQDNLIPRLLDPRVRLAAPAAVADPGGDYAQAFFRLAEALAPGAHQALKDKASTFLGDSAAPRKTTAGQLIAAAFAEGRIDAFVAYLSTCREALELSENLVIITPPPALTVLPEFCLCLLHGAPRTVDRLAEHILSPIGQDVLAAAGFTPLRDLSQAR